MAKIKQFSGEYIQNSQHRSHRRITAALPGYWLVSVLTSGNTQFSLRRTIIYTDLMQTFMDIPVVSFADTQAWETWLKDNYSLQTGVWLKIAKKDSGIDSVSAPQALDVCLCYGWIDGQRRALDKQYYLQKYTPRRKRSLWSKVNVAKVEALTAAGRMQAPGQKEIDAAKADGRWGMAYESVANATVPQDFAEALEKNQEAREFFATLNKSERYAVLWRLMTAKTPAVRQSRLENMLAKLATKTKI